MGTDDFRKAKKLLVGAGKGTAIWKGKEDRGRGDQKICSGGRVKRTSGIEKR